MNESLAKKIQQVREALQTHPMGPVVGNIPAGVASDAIQHAGGRAAFGAYADFLLLADGARCGGIDFWALSELDGNQYRLGGIVDPRSYLCIGQILHECLLIEKFGGDAFILRHPSESQELIPLGPLLEFLEGAVFGHKYPVVVDGGEQDDWYLLLAQLSLA